MPIERFYPIGTPGQPWTAEDRHTWRSTQAPQRSYRDEVLTKLESLSPTFKLQQYGALSIEPHRYPLHVAVPAQPVADAPWALITGGVHGYETSGVQGALAFLREHAGKYIDRVNLVIAPCVSPWGYEVIHRWNPMAVDPNRSFVTNSDSEEARALMNYVRALSVSFLLHIDLHETTDTDETEFRPALAARDGKAHQRGSIPDGFYTVGDTHNPQPAFQAAVIEAVSEVTHIAPAEPDGTIIGCPVGSPGVIYYPFDELGLCAGMTSARFTTTTEVYPDSPNATADICNAAQVAAVGAALDFALAATA